ncbi:Mrm1 [Kluyveromyces lactis]|nr:Mrm1 [Kluyveromyces lactis]
MLRNITRSYSNKIRSAVKVPNESYIKERKVTFDRNFPVHKRTKAWEKDGMDKAEWFRKNYAHVHAREKNARLNNGGSDPFDKKKKYYDRIKQEESSKREQFKSHRSEYAKMHPLQGLKPNPLVDYVFGTNSVISALTAKKREYFVKLHHYGPLNTQIQSLCSKNNIQTEEVDKHRLNLYTNYAVHNNVVLECKPLQPPELSHLGLVNHEACTFDKSEIDYDQAVNTREKFMTNDNKKYPLGIYLDEVVDPHNVGAIIRSAYFLGADFMVLSHKNCAPLSPVVSKVSSGTMELLPIFTTAKPLQFFEKSKQDGGWMFVTSHMSISQKGNHLTMNELSGMLNELPVVLVVGNEGNGVRTNLLNRSDFTVEIPFGRDPTEGRNTIDSLNVSVATALLINGFLN